ncbi:MAG: HNH endonuclease signature motif containing protein [Actinomycetota bacterium]
MLSQHGDGRPSGTEGIGRGLRCWLSHRVSIHHVWPWSRGGTTDLSNLVPLCRQHHHRVHEGGWRMELSPDRRLCIRRPDGACHDPPVGARAGTAREPP